MPTDDDYRWLPGHPLTTPFRVVRQFRSVEHWLASAERPGWIEPGDVCIDARGRPCRIGTDHQRAAYPVTVVRPRTFDDPFLNPGPLDDEPPIEQVWAELKAAGIDTGPAVERVLKAVKEAREKR